GAQVRLRDHEARDEHRDQHERDGHAPRADLLALRTEPGRQIDDEGELREFRRLKPEAAAEAQPARRATGAHADPRYEDGPEQHDGEEKERHRDKAKRAIVEPGGDEHRGDAKHRPRRLLREERARVVLQVECRDAARAVDHREPEEEQHEDPRDERQVVRRGARQPELHEVNDRTIAANFSPRSSAEENMSKEAFAGESRTTSPGRAISRALATASSSVRARRTSTAPLRSAVAIAAAISSAARPIRTAPCARCTSTRASSPKSAPLETPPRIAIAGRSYAARADMVAAGVVAAESLTQR